jgi:hypothetical protein
MKFHLKGFISLLLAICFLILGFSGIIVYLTPRGRVANWTDWTMLGLAKHDWQAIHMNVALLFLIAAGLHVYLNWPIFWSYLKRKGSLALNLKLELLASIVIAAVVLTGVIAQVRPFSYPMTFNYQIKDYWDRWVPDAPQGPALDNEDGHKKNDGHGGERKGQGMRRGRGAGQ